MTQGKCTARRNTEGGGLSGLSQCRKLDPTLNRHCNYAKCPKNRKVLATLMRPFNASQCPEFSTDSVGLFFIQPGCLLSVTPGRAVQNVMRSVVQPK